MSGGHMMSSLGPHHVEVKVEFDVKCKEEDPWDDEEDLQSVAPVNVNSLFYCLVCGRAFGQRHNLIKHQRIHTGERPYCCDQCGKSFIQKQHLTKHQRLHTGERPYVCPVCGRGFSLKHNLTTHGRIHTGEKPFPCNECGKNFSRRENLRAHQRCHLKKAAGRSHTMELEEPGSPSGLDYLLPTVDTKPNQLAVTEKNPAPKVSSRGRTLNPRPFICPQCGKRFFNKQTFINHYRIHTGQRPHACPECGRSFIQKQHLTKHIRTHTGEKPYVCGECGRSFSMKHNLCTHMKTHTGEKPYCCSACGKRFTRRSTYQAHQRIHCKSKLEGSPSGGEDPPEEPHPARDMTPESADIVELPVPITCGQCGKNYGGIGEIPIGCTGCGFNQMVPYQAHQRIHYKPKLEGSTSGGGEDPPEEPHPARDATPESADIVELPVPITCGQCGKNYGGIGEIPIGCTDCGSIQMVPTCQSSDLPKGPADMVTSLISEEKTLLIIERVDSLDDQDPAVQMLENLMNAPGHEESPMGTAPFSCQWCGQIFSQREDLEQHEPLHSGEKIHACRQCGKTFFQKNLLIKHEKIHEDRRSSHNPQGLKHLPPTQQWTTATDKPYPCDKCGKSFSHQETLTLHQRSHQRYSSPITTEPELKDKQKDLKRVNGGQGRAFPCSVCGKSFNQKHTLINHLRIHSGERPYPCPVCGKSFIQKQHLTKHVRLHTGERPYSCQECGRSFSLKHNLTTHQRIHTGERPYACNHCGKRFNRRGILLSHERIHLQEAAQTSRKGQELWGRPNL